jgi:hypothetical protein
MFENTFLRHRFSITVSKYVVFKTNLAVTVIA